MNEETYKAWWQLHIRVARGETLRAEERAVYEAGLQQLDVEETLPGSIERLRQARERAEKLEEERVQLQTRYDALKAEIAALESRLSKPAKQLLGVKD